jgi:hypothetical protein
MSTFTLQLSDEERTELLNLVENSLKETRVEVHRTHTPDYRASVMHEEDVLRGLLGKLRGSGA